MESNQNPSYSSTAASYVQNRSIQTKNNNRAHYESYQDSNKQNKLSPGLKAELEFQLRHYARINQGCVNLHILKDRFEGVDTYRTGKLLHREVRS